MPKLSKSDEKFLLAVGITPESIAPEPVNTSLAEERLALAKRIAKHAAPAQVKVDPNAARPQLIRLAAKKLLAAAGETAKTDGTLQSLIENHIPTTRHNYLFLAFAGNPPEPLPPGIEAELPWFLREDNR